MLEVILAALVFLWLFGYLEIPWLVIPRYTLFYLNGHVITLRDVIIFILVAWAIGILPSPFRQIAGILLLLWIASLLGIFVISGLSNLLILAIIIGIGISLFSHK